MSKGSQTSTVLSATDRVVRRSWWKRKPVLVACLGGMFILAMGASALMLPASDSVQVDASSLDIAVVSRGPFQDYLLVRAEVVPLDVTVIAADTGGRVESVDAVDGEMVRQGQILAHLSDPALMLAVSLQQVGISTSQSQMNEQMVALKKSQEQRERDIADATYGVHKAEQELSKKQYLRDANLINDMVLKSYLDEVAYQEARLSALKNAQDREKELLASQMRQITQSAEDLRKTSARIQEGLKALLVLAPRDGRLSGFDLKPGQSVRNGDMLGEVASDSRYKVRAQVDEFYLSRLQTGLVGTAQLHGRPVSLKLSKVLTQVTDGRITVEMEFLDRIPVGLKFGEAIDIKLSLGDDMRDAMSVPAGGWLDDGGGGSIFVLSDRGSQADRRKIAIGRRNPDAVEVVSGLSPGERVVTGEPLSVRKAQHLLIRDAH
ncbi:MAG: HlyD family efflux transporter periplasmic adaptor subunit [Clostridiaceae bacterium]|nr:HlyD family efflux transporter periplasmic adaptor subunit [Clostridiaceae bacterium]